MRGEHVVPVVAGYNLMGSSPHARGARKGEENGTLLRGIIPACAGSTRTEIPRESACRDHPRMRGEHRVCDA